MSALSGTSAHLSAEVPSVSTKVAGSTSFEDALKRDPPSGLRFERTYSGHSTEVGDGDIRECEGPRFDRWFSETSDHGPVEVLPPSCDSLEQKLQEVKELFRMRYGQDVDDESEEEYLDDDQSICYEDGVKYIVTHGPGPQFCKVQEIYADGVMWTVTRGRPLSIEKLSEQLDEVKEMLDRKCGPILTSDVRGAPPSYDALEMKLQEVKALFNIKYGQDVDEDADDADDLDDDQSIVYEDGVKYIVTHGAGPQPSTVEVKFVDGINWVVTRGRSPSVDTLLERLEEVKRLYNKVHGSDALDVSMARGPPPSFDALDQRIFEVKALFKAKYGVDVDDEESDEETDLDDDQSIEYEGGVKYIVTHGPGPQFGKVEEKMVDGIQWIVTRGRPLSISALEEQLEQVKELYQSKHEPQSFSDSEESDAGETHSENPRTTESNEEGSWGCVCA
eukprot:TRINITY_DN30911_c0_g1_i1.p1 TRINITY_DN30911_c0_g1~~TRINITY_DN30911_c0_g1_i1.p1  ORF type:complete len:447 (-),score=81.61 TRINITY_DN30911_c0_g1_i1:290-1630(-)